MVLNLALHTTGGGELCGLRQFAICEQQEVR